MEQEWDKMGIYETCMGNFCPTGPRPMRSPASSPQPLPESIFNIPSLTMGEGRGGGDKVERNGCKESNRAVLRYFPSGPAQDIRTIA